MKKYFLLVTLVHSIGWSSGWVHEQHSFYSELSFGHTQSDELFDASGSKIANRVPLNPGNILLGNRASTYKQNDLTLYLEYGLGLDTEIQISVPYVLAAKQEIELGAYQVEGLSDLNIGFKHNWLNLPWIVSAIQVTLGVPTGDEKAKSNGVGNYVPQTIPLGDGEYDVLTRLHVSHAFSKIPLYASTNVGYRFRDLNGGTGLKNDFHWGCDAGYSIDLFKNSNWFSKITPTFTARGLHSFTDGGSSTNPALILSGNVPGQSQIDVQPGLFLSIWKKLSLNTSYSSVVWGKNTGAGWTLRTGVAWEH